MAALAAASEAQEAWAATPSRVSFNLREFIKNPHCHFVYRATIALRWRPLNVVLRRLAQQKSRAATRLSTERVTAQAVAAAFDWSSAIVRSHGRCLPRSIAVAQRLARLGISADLVVGVSLYPFAAHSWVQCSSALVNDRLDGVRHFTPILVI